MGIQRDSNSGGAPHEVPTGVDTTGNVGIGATGIAVGFARFARFDRPAHSG